MKTVRNSIIIIAAFFSLTMLACSNLSTSDDSDGTVESPTLAELVGTWKQTTTDAYGETTEITETTLIVSPDGSFFSREKTTTTSGSDVSYDYDFSKGALSVSDDEVTEATTHTAYNDTGADPADGDWIARPFTTRGSAIFVDGRLYRNVHKAKGSVSGLLGTWTMVWFDSSKNPPYEKEEERFGSDGSFTTILYSSTDGIDYTEGEPVSDIYTLNGDGSFTLELDIEGIKDTITLYYRIVDSYLIIGDTTSADANAYIKQ